MRERIETAAIRFNGEIITAPRPARHGDIIRIMVARNRNHHPRDTKDQGFVTNAGRFVGRKEAFVIAMAANQLLIPDRADRAKKHGNNTVLFSEDIF